ncbi:MAG: hypothetical protein E6Q61_05450 [Nitrosomonas sp.]|nr:MAG: hypothetical protein E6Q61_05450 [Nitrosomonas sp.]
MNPWLETEMADVFTKMQASGQEQFTLAEIQGFVHEAANEAATQHAKEMEAEGFFMYPDRPPQELGR